MKNSNGDRPKVLIFSPRPSGGGGVDNFVQTLRQKLASDVEAELFLIGQPGSRSGRWLRPLVPIYDAFRLAALLVRRRHDVYHLNPSLLPQAALRDGLFLLVLRLFRRRNVLVFIHGWSTSFYRRISHSPIRRGMFRFAYDGAAHIIVLASTFKTDLAAVGIPAQKIGVHTTMFDGELLKSIGRDRKDSEIRILFMARLVAAKGIYELLEAFQMISLDDPTLVLIIAGDGPEAARAQLWCRQQNLQQRVLFPGYVDGATKAKLLVDADIFALPTSHGEGCPVALLEAMAAGLPVIVTAVGGIPDIVRDGVNGLVLDTTASHEIADALKRLVNNPSLRAQLGNKNRVEAWQKYEAGSMSSAIAVVYRRLASQDTAV